MIESVTNNDRNRHERAAEWCMRLAERHLNAEEQAAFDHWASADPRNARAFEEALAVWSSIDAISGAPELIGYRAEAVEALRQVNARRWSRGMPLGWRWPLVVAACLAFVVLAALFYIDRHSTHYETDIGERRVILLTDGSRLTLDAASHVDVRLTKEKRSIELLAGRAKFDVAHDPLRPFSVRTNNHVTVATGTTFSVELLPNEVRVVLYEGEVEIINQPDKSAPPRNLRTPDAEAASAPPPPALTLQPGKEFIASTVSKASRVIEADMMRSQSWESGLLIFEGEPLALAAERMNRYAKERIVIQDRHAASYGVSGVFEAGNSEAFVEGVTTLYPIQVTRKSGQLVLAGVREGIDWQSRP